MDSAYIEILEKLISSPKDFLSTTMVNHLDRLLNGEDEYMEEGIKYNLWKASEDDIDVITRDIKRVTGKDINKMEEDEMMSSIEMVSDFLIGCYNEYTVHGRREECVYKILKKKRKSKKVKIWLRYHIRLSSTVPPEESKGENLGYIG